MQFLSPLYKQNNTCTNMIKNTYKCMCVCLLIINIIGEVPQLAIIHQALYTSSQTRKVVVRSMAKKGRYT